MEKDERLKKSRRESRTQDGRERTIRRMARSIPAGDILSVFRACSPGLQPKPGGKSEEAVRGGFGPGLSSRRMIWSDL